MLLGKQSLHQVYLLWMVASDFIWLYARVVLTEVEMGVATVLPWAVASGGSSTARSVQNLSPD